MVGVSVGVCVGVLVGVWVGVLVGVGVAPLNELTTSPLVPPFLFQRDKSFSLPPDVRLAATLRGEFAELTVVALDHEEYGLDASEYFTVPLSTNQHARFDEVE